MLMSTMMEGSAGATTVWLSTVTNVPTKSSTIMTVCLCVNPRRLTFVVVVFAMRGYSVGSSSESSLNSTPILSMRSASIALAVKVIVRLS